MAQTDRAMAAPVPLEQPVVMEDWVVAALREAMEVPQ
jgi:hypothetical protein